MKFSLWLLLLRDLGVALEELLTLQAYLCSKTLRIWVVLNLNCPKHIDFHFCLCKQGANMHQKSLTAVG